MPLSLSTRGVTCKNTHTSACTHDLFTSLFTLLFSGVKYVAYLLCKFPATNNYEVAVAVAMQVPKVRRSKGVRGCGVRPEDHKSANENRDFHHYDSCGPRVFEILDHNNFFVSSFY